MVLFSNSRDRGQIRTLATQSQIPCLLEATSCKYAYLLIDFHPETKGEHRLKTDIFAHIDGTGPIIYTK